MTPCIGFPFFEFFEPPLAEFSNLGQTRGTRNFFLVGGEPKFAIGFGVPHL
jgi:hypothetical protein